MSIEAYLKGGNQQLLKGLNDEQLEAVTLPNDTNALVIAGAGSGKTRVLTHRLAWLMAEYKYPSSSLVAVTFTNKASGEMRARVEQLVQAPMAHMWIGTFHGLCHRFLRQHAEACGLDPHFQILDSDDQLRLCKQITRELGVDESRYPPRQTAHYIASQKDQGIRSHALEAVTEWHGVVAKVFERYDEICQRDSLVDFAELLLKTVEAWRDQPELLKTLHDRFEHLLIDEFQDTNTTQYAWVRLLAGQQARVFAVGDDDQSIYGWRGAKVENINHFSQDFAGEKPVHIVRLEQNYRSTAHILNTANAIIKKNTQRMGKKLWTNSEQGERVGIYRAINGLDEADFVAKTLQDWVDQNEGTHNDIAVLYRSNAQSRVFEEFLLRHQIPYQIYGGLRFFERAEIKDVLAYARLLVNPDDNTAFARVINVPPRGIGAKSINQIAEHAKTENLSWWQAAETLATENSKVTLFLKMIHSWQPLVKQLRLTELIEHLIEGSGLLKHYAKEGEERLQTRKENLDELVVAAASFEEDGLAEFLANSVLDGGERQNVVDKDAPRVQLMTLHSAKGLEFPLVFLVGMEDGLLPSSRSLHDPAKLAEERRLTYVGVTRARKKLYISFADSRQLYGNQFVAHPPSRFLHDLPESTIDLIG